jgi:hypothetical protein
MKEKNLRRYHNKVYFPSWEALGEMVIEFFKALPDDIVPTHHAAQQLLEDKRGVIELPTKQELMASTNTLVEFYEILDREGKATGKIQKAVIRIHNLSEKYDYTYSVARDGAVITAWAVDKGDEHRLTQAMYNYWVPEELREETFRRLKEEQSKYVEEHPDRAPKKK